MEDSQFNRMMDELLTRLYPEKESEVPISEDKEVRITSVEYTFPAIKVQWSDGSVIKYSDSCKEWKSHMLKSAIVKKFIPDSDKVLSKWS